ncbi:MAG: leucine-rich repeat protein, partial [Solobacterium sp.]|nr:leucine-rich repeat protein [Solobacterium sp.]
MKRELKRICAFLVTVSCMFSEFPIRILAEEVIPEDTVEITVQTEGEQNNDELFAGYVDQLFSAPKPVTAGGKKAASRKAVNLEGAELAMYNRLHEMASAIAAGERDNAIITFDDADLGLGEQMTWTAERLSVSSVYTDDGIPEDAKRKLDESLTYYYPLNGRKVISLLMANYPYEFYWYDKSIGFTYSYNIGVTFGSDGYALYVTDYQLKMAVAEEYRDMNVEEDPDGNYLCAVNTAVTGAAVTAASNAREIVSQYASLDDTEKLTAYKDKICELVSYNDDAAHNENTAYGNPWQLIWVFDGNETTNVVCEGYSKAFQYLCDMSEFNSSSIACISVTGIMSSDNGSDNHMWNIVTLDDEKNYMADITNSDEGMAGQYGELFLAKQSSGSVDEGYVFQCPGKEIEYEYDEDTLSIYDKNELRLNYEYKENMCGETAYWNFDEATGILTISGSGEVWSARDESGETEVHECPWQSIKQQIKGVVFEEGITTVGNAVFEDCFNLRTVSFCDSITKIGHFAFMRCPIEEVDLPEHLQSIGGGVFTGSLITEVSIPASVTFLMDAFDGCTELRKVYIACPSPDFTSFMHASGMFGGCEKLKVIEVSEGNPYFEVKDNVLFYKTDDQLVLDRYPTGKSGNSYTVPEGTDRIGANAFSKTYLEQIVFSDSITSIEQEAFSQCSELADIQWSDSIKTLGNCVFERCTSLTQVVIPDSVIEIGPGVFEGCTSLRKVILPAGLQKLGQVAFAACSSLVELDIPLGISTIGYGTFWGCTDLKSVSIPETVTSIAEDTFKECSSLSDIYYGSCLDDWNRIVIHASNTILDDKIIHFEGISLDHWEWSDDKEKATAYFVCSKHNTIEKEITIQTTKKTTGNETEYIASVEFNGHTYTDVKKDSEFDSEHNYRISETVWSDDYSTAKVVLLSKNDPSFEMTLDAVVSEPVNVKPTCEIDGFIRYSASVVYNEEEYVTVFEETIPALGHQYGEPVYEWSEDNSTVTATAICENDNTHVVTETVNTTVENTATCTTAGQKTYTAVFENNMFETQYNNIDSPALGHDYELVEWNWYDYPGIMQATLVCKNDSSHIAYPKTYVEKEIIPATCEEAGKTIYTATLTYESKEYTGKIEEIIPATGHLYGIPAYERSDDYSTITATVTCIHDSSHIITETAKTVSEDTRPATCENDGLRTYTASFTNTLFDTQTFTVTIPATGHKYGDPKYNWADDNSTVTGTMVCENDETHIITETVNTSYTETKPATPTENGTGTYTAVFNNELFETQTKDIVIPPTGYTYGEPEYVWADDLSTVTAFAAANEGSSGDIKEIVEPTSEIILEPTCEENGKIKYTAVFENALFETQTKEVDTPALEHEWGEPVWEWDESETGAKAVFTCAHDTSHTKTIDAFVWVEEDPATCTDPGLKVTYAEVELNEETYIDKKITELPALGHDWSEPVYEWTEYYDHVTATRICAHDPDHHVETETVEAEYTKIDPTCEETGMAIYTAVFTNPAFGTQKHEEVIEALGHDWGEPVYEWTEDYEYVKATRICANDPDHVEYETVKSECTKTEPTCEEEGSAVYTGNFENPAFEQQTAVITVPALGHEWGEPEWEWSEDYSQAWISFSCQRDNEHYTRIEADVFIEETPATCEEPGQIYYYAKAVFNDEPYTAEKTVPIEPTGHDWDEPEYTWSADFSKVTARRVCRTNSTHIEDETVDTEYTVIVKPDCEAPGAAVYRAEFKNEAFTEQTMDIELPAVGHDWRGPEWEWSEAYDSATAVFTCANNENHVNRISASVSEDRTPATCEEDGKV